MLEGTLGALSSWSVDRL